MKRGVFVLLVMYAYLVIEIGAVSFHRGLFDLWVKYKQTVVPHLSILYHLPLLSLVMYEYLVIERGAVSFYQGFLTYVWCMTIFFISFFMIENCTIVWNTPKSWIIIIFRIEISRSEMQMKSLYITLKLIPPFLVLILFLFLLIPNFVDSQWIFIQACNWTFKFR